MKFTLLLSVLLTTPLNFAQTQTDSLTISDYFTDCIDVVPEKYTLEKDSADFIYSNGKNDFRVEFYYSTEPVNLIVERLFSCNKITINSIYQIITDGYTPREDNPLFLYGIEDLSHLLKDNPSGKFRLIELLVGVGSENPLGIHLLLYNKNANKTDELLDFIVNSQVFCLKYNHMLM